MAKVRKQGLCWGPTTPHLVALQAVVSLLGCHRGTGFVPAVHWARVGGMSNFCRPVSARPLTTTNMSCNNDSNMNQSSQPTRPLTTATTTTTTGSLPTHSSAVNKAAAACFATATILSSSIPADASLMGLPVGGGESGALYNGVPTTLVLSVSDENGGDSSRSNGDMGVVGDVPSLLSELRQADRADRLLNTMVKINDMVDTDEEGLLENPFEKEGIVKGLIDKRRAGGEAWDNDAEVAFGILKRKLDPFNVVLLRPYLRIAPYLGGAYYLAVFFVQQKFRGFFPYAYFAAVAVFIAPAAILLLFN